VDGVLEAAPGAVELGVALQLVLLLVQLRQPALDELHRLVVAQVDFESKT